jgi:hypothetical protein
MSRGEIDLIFASGGEECSAAMGLVRRGYVPPSSAKAGGQHQERKRHRPKKPPTQAAR